MDSKVQSLVLLKKLLTESFKDAMEFIYFYVKYSACDSNLDRIEKIIEDENFAKIKGFLDESTDSILAEIRSLRDILMKIKDEEVTNVVAAFKLNNDANSKKLVKVFQDLEADLKRKSNMNYLQHFDWQISSIEREKKSSNKGNKYEGVELNFKFKISDIEGSNKEKYINMNYFEFKEVFECLKKMDSQLKMFKN